MSTLEDPVANSSTHLYKSTTPQGVTYQTTVTLIYLSFRSCDSCRRLPEPKHHSFLFNHWQ